MIVTDRWQDFELLDAGNGRKLERWGDVILERPDPQALWSAPKWPKKDAVYHRSKKGGGQWEFLKELPNSWVIEYPGVCKTLRFKVEPTGFKHTGLFPEQGANWDFIAKKVQAAKKAGEQVKVLNLFAYTGGATVAAASAGADEVIHVDASKGMNRWAKENIQLSSCDDVLVRFLTDDVMKFVLREQRRGNKYCGIIMDPPSYGRGPRGEVWQLEDALWGLVKETVQLLEKNNPHAFFILNSYTTGFAPSVAEVMLRLALNSEGHCLSEELVLPASQRDIVLPCGNTCRWQREVE